MFPPAASDPYLEPVIFRWSGDCQSVRLQSLCLQCAIWAHIDFHPLCWWLHEPRDLQAANQTTLIFIFCPHILFKLLRLCFFPSTSKWNRIQPFNLHNKCDFNHNILRPYDSYNENDIVCYVTLTVSAQSYHKLCNTESDTSNHCLQHLDGNLDISNHRRLQDENIV